MGRWSDYYDKTKDAKPHDLTVHACSFVQNSSNPSALDLGAGALRDTRYLLTQGFAVTALDSSEDFETFAQSVQDPRLTIEVQAFENIVLSPDKFDLVIASHALPFCSNEMLPEVVRQIVRSLRPQGVFAANFFGPLHSWSDNSTMSFVTSDRVKSYLDTLEILHFTEREYDKPDASGNPVHWHMIDVIARKTS